MLLLQSDNSTPTTKDNEKNIENVNSATWSPKSNQIAVGYFASRYDKKNYCDSNYYDSIYGIIRILNVNNSGQLSLLKKIFISNSR